MKNLLFLVALIVALIAVFAAPARADGIILRGGMNFGSANTDPKIDNDNKEFRRGFNAALLGEVGNGALRLLAGGGYEQRGLRVTDGSNEGQMSLDYVTIPVMLSVGSVSHSPFIPRIFINAGVEPAFLVSSDITLGSFTTDFDGEEFDFGLRGEAGLEIPLSASAGIVLGGGYSQSLTDAIKGDDFDSMSRTIHLFGGLKIGMF
jgi:hypothetical protein